MHIGHQVKSKNNIILELKQEHIVWLEPNQQKEKNLMYDRLINIGLQEKKSLVYGWLTHSEPAFNADSKCKSH